MIRTLKGMSRLGYRIGLELDRVRLVNMWRLSTQVYCEKSFVSYIILICKPNLQSFHYTKVCTVIKQGGEKKFGKCAQSRLPITSVVPGCFQGCIRHPLALTRSGLMRKSSASAPPSHQHFISETRFRQTSCSHIL